MRKNFVAVRAAYYKHDKLTKKVTYSHKTVQINDSGDEKEVAKTFVRDRTYKSAIAELEHVLRTEKTNSVNVFSEFSHQNITISPSNTSSPIDAYYKCRDRYKESTGRTCRSDMNTLFEHVLVLSNDHLAWLEHKIGSERAQKEVVKCLKQYSKRFAERFGFTELGFSLHLDEGHYDNKGQFIRNPHAHLMFYNYDFKNKKSNLRKMHIKSVDQKRGKTNELNKNFVEIQDIAYESFKSLKFKRGKSKVLTMAKYLPKHKFIENQLIDKAKKLHALKKRLKDKKKLLSQVSQKIRELKHDFTQNKDLFFEYFGNWLESALKKSDSKIYTNLTYKLILSFKSNELKDDLTEKVKEIESGIGVVGNNADETSITNNIKQTKNKIRK